MVYVDETGARVDGRRYWIWVFTTLTDTLIVIRRSRGKRVLEEVLGKDFKGVIVCDGWRSYPAFTGHIQRDWAHLLRGADWLAEHFKEARPMTRALHRLYGDLRASLNEDVRFLLSLTGVDVYTALLIRSKIGDINRFPDYKRLIS